MTHFDTMGVVQSGLDLCREVGCQAIVHSSLVEGYRRLQHGNNPEHSGLFYQTGDQGFASLRRYGDGLPSLDWIRSCHQR